MRLHQDINFTTLSWVKPELDETLKLARQALEMHAENGGDRTQMQTCVAQLHQVQGTLRMLELYGAAMVAEEMEQLAQALLEARVENLEEAYGALMRGTMQLPDYLERLQSGHKDIPVVLLPLLNDLRGARGEKGVPSDVFGLQAQQHDEAELAHARGSLTGHNRELLDTVSIGIKEDLLRVKEALDLHLRTPNATVTDLAPQGDALGAIADTLGMLGLGVPRRVVQDQRSAIQALTSGARPADESTLLDIAGALLYVEASLDDQVARLGQPVDAAAQDATALPAHESEQALGALVKESVGNFVQARQCFVGFIEAGWDHAQLNDVPRLLDEVTGAMRILELPRPAEQLHALSVFTQLELLRKQRVPDAMQMDRLADALASLEYYLEALRDRRPQRERILELAEAGLAALGYWPVPQAAEDDLASAHAAAAERSAPADDVPASALDHLQTRPVEQHAIEAYGADIASPLEMLQAEPAVTPAESATAASMSSPTMSLPATPTSMAPTFGPVGFEAGGEDIDDEIREVFLEELGEEIVNLRVFLQTWSEAPHNNERLRPVRRVFHTLKGSGRLVGALTLGEFSWKIENMLNRVLDGTRAPSPAVLALVGQAADALPQLHAALTGKGRIETDLEAMKDIADRVGAGEEIAYVPTVVAAPVVEPEPVLEAEPVEAIAEFEPVVDSVEAVESLLEPAYAELPVAEMEEQGELANVDPVLLEILRAEVGTHLLTLQDWVDAATATPQVVTDALLRAVHTMNGAFAMTEVPVITELLTPTESYLRRLLAHSQFPSTDGVHLLGDTAIAVLEVLEALHRPQPRIAPQDALIARAIALRDTLAEPTAPSLPTHVEEIEDTEVEEAQAVAETSFVATEAEIPDFSALPAYEPSAEELAALEQEAVEHQWNDASAMASEPEQSVAESIDLPNAASAETATTDFDTEANAFEETAAAPEAAEAESEANAASEAIRLEAERIEAERLEYEQLEAEYAQADRLAAEQRVEAERVEAARVEAERIDAERVEAERLQYEQLEAEYAEDRRVKAEHAEAERAEAERVEVERAEAERVEAERIETERAEAERVAERAEAERAEADRLEAERLEYEKLEAEYAQAEQVKAERIEAERVATAAAIPTKKSKRGKLSKTPARAIAEPAAVEPAVAQLLASVSDTDPDEPLDLTDVDPELLDIFIEETTDILDHADGLLSHLRDTPTDREPVTGLQRDLHTLKGGARMAGMMSMGELAHAMESVLEASAENRIEIGSGSVSALERGFDRLHGMLTRIQQRQAVALPALMIAEFNALAHGQPLPVAAPAPVSETMEHAEHLERAPAKPQPARPVLKPLSAPVEAGFDEDDDIGVRAPQEQVRIRADLLDRLVNYAGEVAIYRARLEQQLGGFRTYLVEMEITSQRLREQLRKLEIETEAQISARYQREDDETTFDPLELDRFSTQQQLTRALAETAADIVSLQGSLDDITSQYETLLLQQSRVSSDLQEGLMRTRMVPFDALVPRLRRVLRQTGAETGKQVQLKVEGAQGEMDRNVLDRMTAPMEHMLRNAAVHGLETPAERRAAGKPEEGIVTVSVRREGSEVVMVVADDGRGLDRDAIRAKAIERGLLKDDATIGDQSLYAFILESGFSTAENVSRLAGRGVGMDVVHNEIRQLGGSLQLDSTPGRGSRFTIRLPFTLAVTQAALVKIGETSFAVPISSVQGVGRIARSELEKQLASGHPVYIYAGEEYAIYDLGKLLGQAPARAQGSLQMPLLLSRSGDQRTAITVDEVQGSREIVVKPVGPQVSSVPGIFGATIMGDGGVMVILDVVPLVRRQLTLTPLEQEAAPLQEVRRVPLVMVVDDSITMRKVTGRVLERNNMEVLAAKDGIDAIEKMVERVPDLMLLDIEMPRMDGYELATHMRNDARLRDVPIVMITSRTGEKHRQRAFEIGVNRYLGKPYQEAELMRNVFDLLNAEHEDA